MFSPVDVAIAAEGYGMTQEEYEARLDWFSLELLSRLPGLVELPEEGSHDAPYEYGREEVLLLGDLFGRIRPREQIVSIVNDGCNRFPQSPDFHVLRLLLDFGDENYSRSVDSTVLVMRRYPASLYELAELETQEEFTFWINRRIMQQAEQLLEETAGDDELLLLAARCRYVNGNPEQALAQLDDMADRQAAEPNRLRATILLKLERQEEAIAPFRQYLAQQPDDLRAAWQLVQCCFASHRPAEGIEEGLKYVDLPGSKHLLFHFIGVCCESEKRLEEAEAWLLKAVAEPEIGNWDTPWYSLGHVRNAREDYSGAEAAARQAIELEENYPNYSVLANALMGQERWAEAVEAWREAEVFDPSRKWAPYELALCYYKLGENDSALEFARLATARGPDLADFWARQAVIEHSLKLYEESRVSLERALEIDPDYRFALRKMAGWHSLHGDPADSAGFYIRLAELSPEDPELAIDIATEYYEAGMYEEMAEWASRAYLELPASHEALFLHGAGLMLVDNQPDEARDLLIRARSLAPADLDFDKALQQLLEIAGLPPDFID